MLISILNLVSVHFLQKKNNSCSNGPVYDFDITYIHCILPASLTKYENTLKRCYVKINLKSSKCTFEKKVYSNGPVYDGDITYIHCILPPSLTKYENKLKRCDVNINLKSSKCTFL